MENINELIEELKKAIQKAKEITSDNEGRTRRRVVGTLMASEYENAGYELQLPYLGISQNAEVTLRNIPCGNDPRIFADKIKNEVFPVIGIPKEDISIKMTYDEGFSEH